MVGHFISQQIHQFLAQGLLITDNLQKPGNWLSMNIKKKGIPGGFISSDSTTECLSK